MSSRLALATSSTNAANAGAAMARAGGNAVDAAIAAALVAINTEPGVCSLGCGGYITIWKPGQTAVTLDGYVAAPGLGVDPAATRNSTEVYLEYGGGVTTIVGPDSIGVAGGVAVLGHASHRYGQLPWHELFEPVIGLVREGFPLPQASYQYLVFSGEPIFSRASDGRAALFDEGGALRDAGAAIRVPHLADTLERIALKGPQEFYTGDVGRAIADFVIDNGGRLGRRDMAAFEVIERPSLLIPCDNWQIATNPPPAIGGTTLGAMLQLMSASAAAADGQTMNLARLIEVQTAVLGYRRGRLDLSDDIEGDAAWLLDQAQTDDLRGILQSGSTCHTSAVDGDGLACAVTLSAGYGAGDMPPGTGIWLNNCLGELELNRRGLDIGPPGTRLPSNMAPCAARDDHGTVMAIGSPGADRITTALLQTLINHIHGGMPLAAAIEHPRAHVEFIEDQPRVAYEAGLEFADLEIARREFAAHSMFFGGVAAACLSPDGGFTAAADSRRSGGTWQPED